MINFKKEKNIVYLYNDNISYIIYINSKNYLQHVYFGKRINDFDIESYLDLGWDWPKTYLGKDIKEYRYEDGFYNDRSLMEMATHGIHDKRGAPIILKDKEGNTYTDLRYTSHRIYQGKPVLEGLPHSFGEKVSTIEFKLFDEYKNVEVILSYSIFDDKNIIVRNTIVKNVGKEKINLIRAYSLELDIPSKEFDLVYFNGDWCTERFLKRVPLMFGKMEISSNNGRSGHEMNPFAILACKNTDERSGAAIGVSFVYSGNFTIKTNVDKWETTRVMVGINDEDFDFELKPEEEFVVPEGILVYADNGFNELSHNMHDFIRDNLIRFKTSKEKRAVLFNSWEGCYLDFNTQTILDYIEDAVSIGAELFVLDDGWFGHDRNTDDRSLGDWFVNKNKVDLDRIIKKCHDNKIQFGIWFEPEMINPNSDLYRENSKYALGKENKERTLSRHQLVLDTSSDVAVERVYGMICKILDKYPIDYVKWDHNRCIAEIESSSKYQETYHRLVLGYYKLINKLQNRYPSILFEGCASGGGRFDLGALYYTPQIWTSDETDPIQRLFIQYSTSIMYPLSSMGTHISKSKMTSYRTKGHIALFGTYGFEMNPCLLKEEEKKEILEVTEIYHKYHNEVIQNGDLYRLCSPFTSNYMSMMSVSKDKSKALVLFVNLLKENNHYRYLKLDGLDKEKLYKNNLDNKVYSGEYYMTIGLNLTRWLDEFTSFLVILEEEK